jgi:hypothetical protein
MSTTVSIIVAFGVACGMSPGELDGNGALSGDPQSLTAATDTAGVAAASQEGGATHISVPLESSAAAIRGPKLTPDVVYPSYLDTPIYDGTSGGPEKGLRVTASGGGQLYEIVYDVYFTDGTWFHQAKLCYNAYSCSLDKMFGYCKEAADSFVSIGYYGTAPSITYWFYNC